MSCSILVSNAYAFDYYVSPKGNDTYDGLSTVTALKSIQKAIEYAQPGDNINLAPSTYNQDFVTVRDGIDGAPIMITGPKDAVVKGGGKSRIVQIYHDHIILDGFTINGRFDESAGSSGYRDILVYALGKEPLSGVNGMKIKNMSLTNAGGECVRLRYYAQGNEIAYNTITNCGVYDFMYNAGGKNGEGVYIGTAPEQQSDGKNPTSDPDQSNNNWIHHNVINTQGNECVDIKENSSSNIIEYNKCTGQKDTNSGGMDSRGNNNIFRYNEIYGNRGAGVRLGGDTSNDGIYNSVYENNIHDNEKGGIKFQREPQDTICGNTMTNNTTGDAVGTYGSKYTPTESCSTDNDGTLPTPGEIEATNDAYVRDGAYAYKNYGGATILEAKDASENYNRMIYFNFDVGSVKSIDRVKLRFYAGLTRKETVTTTLYTVPHASWSENSITWNNKPAVGASIKRVTLYDKTYVLNEIDVTEYVKNELEAGKNKIGFALDNVSPSTAILRVKSKESDTDGPTLVFE